MKLTKLKNIKAKPVLKYLTYSIVFIFFVYFFTLILLPYGRIKTFAAGYLNSNTGLKFSIKSASYSFPFDIRFNRIIITDKTGGSSYGNIGSVDINASPLVLASLIFRKALLDVSLRGVDVNEFNAGFAKIPPIRIDSARINLAAYLDNVNNKNIPVKITGRISLSGDLSGAISSINADFYRGNGALRFNGGFLKIKPSPSIEKSLSFILSMAFKKGKGGYYSYNLKNRAL